MGFLSRLLGLSRPQDPEGDLQGAGTYDFPIVGESHYQDALEQICGGRTEEGADVFTEAVLVLDDNNPYDSKAVRVEINGSTVGHLSREDARQYRRHLAEGEKPRLRAHLGAHIRGGWDRGKQDKGHFGVYLDLPVE